MSGDYDQMPAQVLSLGTDSTRSHFKVTLFHIQCSAVKFNILYSIYSYASDTADGLTIRVLEPLMHCEI
jgi:hypothetical protein